MRFKDKSLANTLKEAGCQIFLNTLDKIDGAKDLVLSETILVQLDAICGMQKLRQNAVDKVFKLRADPVMSDTINRVYVIRPLVDEVRVVANQIDNYLTREDHQPVDVKFWIIFVPRMLHCCDLALEEEGIYEYVTVLECPLGLIPIEYDVYSLEDETIFKTLFLSKDITPLSDVVNSIVQLQLLSGQIVDVHGQGRYSENVARKLDESNLKYGHMVKKKSDSPQVDMNRLQFSDENHNKSNSAPSFTDIYLFDRDTDYASVLLSQLNYEGILDESFNICCNKLEFRSQKAEINQETVRHILTSEHDSVFRDIRDKHFSTVFSLLKIRAHEVKAKQPKSQQMNIANLRNFVANELKGLQAEIKLLDLHISACEEIMLERNKYDFSDQLKMEQNIIDGLDIKKCLAYIKKVIDHQLNPLVPLRLLSLLSLSQGGLVPRDYQRFHSSYCENYGLFNNDTFLNLKKLGLITEMDLSLTALTGNLINYSSNGPKAKPSPPTTRLASLTGVMSSLTERASGRVAAVVSTSVLPRRGSLSLIMKKFQLVPDCGEAGYNIREPKDPAFVFNGAYIPLVCQLVSLSVLNQQKKDNSINLTPELVKILPGPNFKRKQAFLDKQTTSSLPQDIGGKVERSLLIYFIGGVTYAEITALRFLAKQRNIEIAIATTSIINGNKLIKTLSPV